MYHFMNDVSSVNCLGSRVSQWVEEKKKTPLGGFKGHMSCYTN